MINIRRLKIISIINKKEFDELINKEEKIKQQNEQNDLEY